ncbi:MAG: radical SAM protein [Phycisphaerales bacterium]|nr:radical SAM protein [Phycisphaerales bacterium]
MSRILFLQCYRRSPSAAPRPRFDMSIGVMAAILREQGHESRLHAVTACDLAALLHAFDAFAPDAVFVSIDGTAVDLARRALAELGNRKSLPIYAGGAYATLLPSTALSMPGVCGVVVGEPDLTFPRIVSAGLIVAPETARAWGVLLRGDSRAPHFQPAALIEDLDDLPCPDRGIFGASPVESEFEVVVGRGCPMRCAYCVNDPMRTLYDEPPGFVRRRSPDHVCDEIDDLCLAYPQTERIRFSDHPFALDHEWLEEFAAVYANRCGLPFSCHVRASSLDEATADLLHAAGCDLAEIELISGSNFIRNEIFDMDTSARQIDRTFELLRDRGIRTHAINYAGAPYSTEITEADTVKLNRRLAPDGFEVRVYYPFPNTKASGIAREMGWLSNRGEACYAEDKSVLDMPTLPARAILRIARRMPHEVTAPPPPAWLGAFGRLPILPGRTLADLVALLRPRAKAIVTQRR